MYLEDDQKREEFINNDKGKVYVGAYKKPRGRPWAFGQFDDVVLPVACYILELSRFPHSARGNPVKVVRAISAGVSIGVTWAWNCLTNNDINFPKNLNKHFKSFNKYKFYLNLLYYYLINQTN